MNQSDLTLYAFRYAIGRRTYAALEVSEHLIAQWDELTRHIQKLIVSEIEAALQKQLAGDKCDEDCWQNVLERAKRYPEMPSSISASMGATGMKAKRAKKK